jgi:ATP-dependent helicase/nuclease subunit B
MNMNGGTAASGISRCAAACRLRNFSVVAARGFDTHWSVNARFLLGPAGSGKTFRCLAEIRAELLRSPDGPPLLLLAPKQATFQLERQLLAEGSIHGFTRLQILSFDRLARFILSELSPAPPQWMDEGGRVMVLRALLARERTRLKIFHSTARLPGFATRLSALLRELQRQQISSDALTALAQKITQPRQLCDKLHDFALLLRAYQDWLATHSLRDADSMLDEATEFIRSLPPGAGSPFQIAGLWVDGFAEMTLQELDLLGAIAPHCASATLAFCLDAEPTGEESWLSPWNVIGTTMLRCRERLQKSCGETLPVELLAREASRSRFASNSTLATLEAKWAVYSGTASGAADAAAADSGVHLACCADPETEAVLAAREIRRFVREGGRFRDCAVIVRSLESHAEILRRVFTRYEIPCFMDRREPVSHHPLAELTRSALRTVAFGWRRGDWFGALKTGLTAATDAEVDWLENLALKSGWEGDVWLRPFAGQLETAESQRAESLRVRTVPPFLQLAAKVREPVSGVQLAIALREFWSELAVDERLDHWGRSAVSDSSSSANPHSTVLEQLHAWLDNLEMAFPQETFPLREWLPILETGLTSLTVGVVPPALDQVVIGAVDRSRNPELKLAIVPGLNEGIFPAPPVEDPLLNELERDALLDHGARVGRGVRQHVGHEWFYGYIAFTRASLRLVLTCARSDAQGNVLNPSPFFRHLSTLLPGHTLQPWQNPEQFSDAEHLSEIVVPAIRLEAALHCGTVTPLDSDVGNIFPGLDNVLAKARDVFTPSAQQTVLPSLIEAIHGRELLTSVSGLEDFAACPFKFFVSRTLRAEERREFELDARERGSFQHEVLQRFHLELNRDKKKWRQVSPESARERVRRIGGDLLKTFQGGLFAATESRRFEGETLLRSLETLAGVLVGWSAGYGFDPEIVEAGFGMNDSDWPAWKLDLPDGHTLALRGRIDRLDVLRDEKSGAALVVVMDYKSSARKADKVKLDHGLQLQLPAYLGVLENVPEVRATLNAEKIVPAGVFYVNLRGEFSPADTRDEAADDAPGALRGAFQHHGRFDKAMKPLLDPGANGEQFKTGKQSRDGIETQVFRELLNRTVENLQRFGAEIFSGRTAPEPFRKGRETACDQCDYASVCRFDAWTQSFRSLKGDA